jgi:hypothetical protein
MLVGHISTTSAWKRNPLNKPNKRGRKISWSAPTWLMHTNRAQAQGKSIVQLRLEAEWTADEVAYELETRLSDAQLADIEVDAFSNSSRAAGDGNLAF